MSFKQATFSVLPWLRAERKLQGFYSACENSSLFVHLMGFWKISASVCSVVWKYGQPVGILGVRAHVLRSGIWNDYSCIFSSSLKKLVLTAEKLFRSHTPYHLECQWEELCTRESLEVARMGGLDWPSRKNGISRQAEGLRGLGSLWEWVMLGGGC